MVGLGACTLYIGIKGSLQGQNELILIAAVVCGAIIGTLLDIDGKISRFAASVESRFQKFGNAISIAEGLVSATLLFCVGSMTVTGSNLMGITKIKVADYLPAILLAPVFCNLLPLLETFWGFLSEISGF